MCSLTSGIRQEGLNLVNPLIGQDRSEAPEILRFIIIVRSVSTFLAAIKAKLMPGVKPSCKQLHIFF